MLKQYDFAFDSKGIENVYSEIAVKIHGLLMHAIPDADAKNMHKDKYHPFSLFCIPSEDGKKVITRISSLNESGNVIVDTASKLDKIKITGMGEVKITKKGSVLESELSELVAGMKWRKYRLEFLTPSVFKVGGKETSLPDVTMHFLSVIRRMNEFEGENIDFDEFRKAFYKCRLGAWDFRSFDYNITGVRSPGMVGSVEINLPDEENLQLMLKKVFVYASFSGTGGRTGMGMGGFFFQKR